jgi:hypothetical protein
MEHLGSFKTAVKGAFFAASEAAKLKYQEMKKQPLRTKEEDRITPVDISISIDEASSTILSEWALKTLPVIETKYLTINNRVEGTYSKAIYKGRSCLIKSREINQDSLAELFIRIKMGTSIGLPLISYGISDHKISDDFTFTDHSVCLLFDLVSLEFPMDIPDKEMALVMWGVHSLFSQKIDIPDIGHVAIWEKSGDVGVHLDFDDGFFMDEPYLNYETSITFLVEKYYTNMGTYEHTPEKVLEMYIHGMTLFYPRMDNEQETRKLYDCFIKSVSS